MANMPYDKLLIALNINDGEYPEDIQLATTKALDLLTSREAEVLKHRFGLFGYEEKTLRQTSEHICNLGGDRYISSERVRQMEAKALRKLRHPSRKNIYLSLGFTQPSITIEDDIRRLGLSFRTNNQLLGNSRHYSCPISVFTNMTKNELLAIPNFGRVSLQHLKDALSEHGWTIKEAINGK